MLRARRLFVSVVSIGALAALGCARVATTDVTVGGKDAGSGVDVQHLSDAILQTCGNSRLDPTEQCDDGNTRQRRRLQPAVPARGQLELRDARAALRLHRRVRQRPAHLRRGLRRRQQGGRRRLLGRLPDRRDRLAVPRAGEEVRPAVRRRRADRDRAVRRRQRRQRRRLLQHLPARAGGDLSHARHGVHQIGLRQRRRSRPARPATPARQERPVLRRRHRLLQDLHQRADLPRRRRPQPGVRRHLRQRQHRGPGEECDDGNLVDGDGCSSTCTGRRRVHLHRDAPRPDTAGLLRPTRRSSACELPIIYRDFKSEHEVGGHPDFFYLGRVTPRCGHDPPAAPRR